MAAIQLIYLLVRHAVCKANDESEVVITNSLVDGLLTASKVTASNKKRALGRPREAPPWQARSFGSTPGLCPRPLPTASACQGLTGDSGEESNGPAGLAALAAGAARKVTTAREYDLGLAKRNAAQHFPSMAMM